MPDDTIHELYELCVQSPTHLVPLLRAIHGADPRVLAEDFCGTAALSRAWVQQVEGGRALAVDADPEVISAARDRGAHDIDLIQGDVIDATTPPADYPADILFVGNFSIGYWHTRADLVRYLRHAHARLSDPRPADPSPSDPSRLREQPAPCGLEPQQGTRAHARGSDPSRVREHASPSGLFLCDTYGGESAFLTGHVHRDHRAPDGCVIRYTWEQREADPTTGRVVNAIHFRVSRGGVIEQEIHDAFVYHWRLWSIPELRDAMTEAGFTITEVYAKVADAVDDEGNAYVEPVTDPADLDDSFIVLVAARP